MSHRGHTPPKERKGEEQSKIGLTATVTDTDDIMRCVISGTTDERKCGMLHGIDDYHCAKSTDAQRQQFKVSGGRY